MNCHKTRAAIELSSPHPPLHDGAQRHLANCQGCRQYADELRSLIALLNAPRRVSVPADFDFRLRARIAAAQQQQRRLPTWLESFWTLPFSWGQAAGVMAAIVVVVACATVYLRQQALEGNHGIPVVASVKNPPSLNLASPSEPQRSELAGQIRPDSSFGSTLRLRYVKPSLRTKAAGNGLPLVATANRPVPEEGMVGRQIIIRDRSGVLQMVTVSEYTFGAQGALARSAVNPETAQMTQAIF